MAFSRRLQHESLESRRLLAVDCLTADLFVESETVTAELQAVSSGEGEVIPGQDSLGNIAYPILPFPFLSYGPDLVQEVGDKIYVVDQLPYGLETGTLFVFQRDAEGLQTVAEVDLGFAVQEMIVSGDQVVLIGSRAHDIVPLPLASADSETLLVDAVDVPIYEFPKTIAVTVDLGVVDPASTNVDGANVVRQEFEGIFHNIHHDVENSRIVVVSTVASDAAQIAIYPPPPLEGFVRTFDITPNGLDEGPSHKSPAFGMSELRGDQFFIANNVHDGIVYIQSDANTVTGDIRPPDVPTSPIVTVSQYQLGPDLITQTGKLELGVGYLTHFDVAADALTAVVVRSIYAASGPTTFVDLLAANPVDSTDPGAGNGLRVHETVELEGFAGQVVSSTASHVVLRDFANNSLVFVNTDQSIDPLPENRVRRLELPDNLHIHFQSLQVTDDLLVLRADRTLDLADETLSVDPNGVIRPDVLRNTILLTVSIPEARIIADTHLPDDILSLPHEQMFLIDAETQRFGFMVHQATSTGSEAFFLFGHLQTDAVTPVDGTPDGIGEFIPEGRIPVGARWLEIDANSERLLVREPNQLVEYLWGDLENPIVTPLGAPDPAIEAVDDVYTLHDNGEDKLLNVLANDVLDRWRFETPVQIVEVIGAPEGTEIVEGGRWIRIPGEALSDVPSLNFEYVISNGETRSSAAVKITVISISEERIRELVEAVRVRAAEDLGVTLDEVEVVSVERIFHERLPFVSPNHPDVIDLSPGILVALKVPDATALYAASLDGEIIQLRVTPRQTLVELGLRAVDADGQPVDQVTEGDEFWIEFNAVDLREHAKGVFAAFFDLVVPTEHLVITGPVEFGPDFGDIPGGTFSEGEIDDLGGIGSLIEHTYSVDNQILRIGARAVGAGDVTLQPEPPDDLGNEILLRGNDYEVPIESVRFVPMQLSIVDASDPVPFDADGNGVLSASDALVVINFLGRFGSTLLETGASLAGAEGEPVLDMETMRRYDTNSNGEITPLDALVVINRLTQTHLVVASIEAEKTDLEAEIPVDELGQSNLF